DSRIFTPSASKSSSKPFARAWLRRRLFALLSLISSLMAARRDLRSEIAIGITDSSVFQSSVLPIKFLYQERSPQRRCGATPERHRRRSGAPQWLSRKLTESSKEFPKGARRDD